MADNHSNQLKTVRWADIEEEDEDFVKSFAAPTMRLSDVLVAQPKAPANATRQRPRWSDFDDDEEEQEEREEPRPEPKTRTLLFHRPPRILQRHQRRKNASKRGADLLAPILEGEEEDVEEEASSSHNERAGSEACESTDVPADEGSADEPDEDWEVVAPKKMKNKKAEASPLRPAVAHTSRTTRPAAASAR
mmetsp:Transcript_94092/g.236161  ORF Transcript_94092/g.236161 Transcript_94092/m.236161 type:complete len:192 (-) Transcript_94092:187-762(-)